MPPDLHWAAVLVISFFTFGIFGMYWSYREASFVKKIDTTSNAVQQWLGIVACFVLMNIVVLVGIVLGALGLVGVGVLAFFTRIAFLAMVGLIIYTAFGMRTSLLRHYTTVEPIGLQLSPVMTFFFNFTYLQYHFSKIAAWKKSQPQTA